MNNFPFHFSCDIIESFLVTPPPKQTHTHTQNQLYWLGKYAQRDFAICQCFVFFDPCKYLPRRHKPIRGVKGTHGMQTLYLLYPQCWLASAKPFRGVNNARVVYAKTVFWSSPKATRLRPKALTPKQWPETGGIKHGPLKWAID